MSDRTSHDLMMSFRAVAGARAALERARTRGSLPGTVSEQRELLAALESCAVALSSHGQPMPHRMQAELAMYRSLFNTKRPRGR